MYKTKGKELSAFSPARKPPLITDRKPCLVLLAGFLTCGSPTSVAWSEGFPMANCCSFSISAISLFMLLFLLFLIWRSWPCYLILPPVHLEQWVYGLSD